MVTSSAIRLVHLKLSSEKIYVHFIAACGYAARGLMPDKTEQKQDAEQREFIDRSTTTNKTYTTKPVQIKLEIGVEIRQKNVQSCHLLYLISM